MISTRSLILLLLLPFTFLLPNLKAQPSVVYVNLSHFPIDIYNAGSGLYPGCSTWAVPQPARTCFQQFFAQMVGRGVTGARLMFSFCGGGQSTPLNCSTSSAQSPSASWLSNLDLLFLDMKAAGINNVILTPTFYGQNNDMNTVATSTDQCLSPPQSIQYKWFHAAPFPVIASNNVPAAQGINNAYNCVPANPYFVGWQNLYNVVSAALQKAQARSLTVSSVDIQQELNFVDFTVLARFVYDNKHGGSGNPNVLDSVRYYMGYYGFDSYRVAYSTTHVAPNTGLTAQTDCGSVYGDSARLMHVSSLMSAIGGGVIGSPSGPGLDTSQGLWCGGTTTGMLSFGTYHTPPDVLDIHHYPKSPTGNTISAIQPSAEYDLSAINALVQSYNNGWRGFVSNVANGLILFGEVSDPPNPSLAQLCSGDPKDSPQALVNAFNSSSNPLRGRRLPNGAAGVIFAPWFEPLSTCFSYAPWPSSSTLSPYTPPIPSN